jgi:hypothetical protein
MIGDSINQSVGSFFYHQRSLWVATGAPFSSLEMLFCETCARDEKVSLDSLACYHLECGRKSHRLVGMWEGQTVSRPNSSSSCSYFLMFFDQFWANDRLILLNNIVYDVTEVYLLHILSDYVRFPFQFENKQVKVVSRSTWRHQNGTVWCPGRLLAASLLGGPVVPDAGTQEVKRHL